MGSSSLSTSGDPTSVWVWAAISDIVSVCASSPPFPPSEPSWVCTATRPRRSGSAKFVEPFPPYIVPRSENMAWFWAMGSV